MGPILSLRRGFGVSACRRLTVMLVASALGLSCARRVWAEEVDLAEVEGRLSRLTFATLNANVRRLVGKRAREWARLAEGAAEFARTPGLDVPVGAGGDLVRQRSYWDARLTVVKGRLGLLAIRTAQSRMSGVEEFAWTVAKSATAQDSQPLGHRESEGAVLQASARTRDDESQHKDERPTGPVAAGEPPRVPEFVEAFLSQAREVVNVRGRMLSSELDSEAGARGWRLVEEAEQHYGTVTWHDPLNTGPIATPLVNRNSLELIARSAGIMGQMGDHGFVFGKVGPGWQVKVRGGHSQGDGSLNLIYLYGRADDGSFGRARHFEGSVVQHDDASASVAEERYFVAYNVSGGARVLEMEYVGEGRLKGETASVRVPVFSGLGTYADLSLVGERKLFFRLVRDGEQGFAGLGGVEVDGQLGRHAELSEVRDAAREGGGEVRAQSSIARVLTVGEFPMYLHVKPLDERDPALEYRFLPSEMGSEEQPLQLNEVASWRVSDWADRAVRPLMGKKGQRLLVSSVGEILHSEMGGSAKTMLERFDAQGDLHRLPMWTFGAEGRQLTVSDSGDLHGRGTQVLFGIELPRGVLRSRIQHDSQSGGVGAVWSRLELIPESDAPLRASDTHSSDEENIVTVIEPRKN